MRNVKVTVLMPVRNGEKYIKEAIDSVLNQTFKDFELLIIDDGSTDHTVDIVQSYSDKRIHLKRRGTNEAVHCDSVLGGVQGRTHPGAERDAC